MEDRWWDEGDAGTKDTRRPDITAFNPRDRRRHVIDVVGAWAVQQGGGQGPWRDPGHSANGKAQFKWRSYMYTDELPGHSKANSTPGLRKGTRPNAPSLELRSPRTNPARPFS